MQKIIIIVVGILVLIPVIAMLKPKPITLERARAVFEDNGLIVESAEQVPAPQIQAVEQFTLQVNGARVEIYRYDDEGKIAKNYEYQKTDVGTAIVESMGIADSLGAAPPRATKSDAARKRKYLVVVSSNDDALRSTVIRLFKSL